MGSKLNMDTTASAAELDDDEIHLVDDDAQIASDNQTELEDDIVDEDLDPLDKLPKGAKRQPDGSVILPLNFPVPLKIKKAGSVKARTISELHMHRLNGADLTLVQSAPEETRMIIAFARSSKLSQVVMTAVYNKMVDVDIANAGQVLNNFFASGRTTGQRA